MKKATLIALTFTASYLVASASDEGEQDTPTPQPLCSVLEDSAALMAAESPQTTDPYAPPFYNNEVIPLPEWVKEELRDINSKLRAKLSPADYLEILKGEYFLLGKYKTVSQYRRNVNTANLYEYENLKDVNKLKEKLQQILEKPEDRKLFARAEILPTSAPGIYYRDTLRQTDGDVIHVQSHYVLTSSQGFGEALSTLWTLWDSRTCRILSQLAIPQMVTLCGSKTLSDGKPVYFSLSPMGEHGANSWNQNIMSAAYIWAPLHHLFQQLHADWEGWPIITRSYSKPQQGDLWNICDFGNEINVTPTDEGNFSPGSDWTMGEKNDLKELGIKQTASYVTTTQQQDGSILFFKTSDRDGQEIDATTPAEKLKLSDLTRRSVMLDNTAHNQRTAQLKHKLAKILQQKRQLVQLFAETGETSLNEAKFIFGEECKGWIPFVIATLHINEGTGGEPSLMGLISPQEEVYLYDWKNLNALFDKTEQKAGRFIPLSEITTEFPYVQFIHFIRQLSLHEASEEGKLIFAFAGDGDSSTEVARLIIDTQDMSYTVDNIRKHSPSKLAPRWIEQQNMLLRPITDESYQIIRLDDNQETILGTMYMNPGQGYAIVLANGHYAGSPGCESFLGFAEGENSIGLKTLAPWRNRPAEVLETFGGNADDIAALKAATERWLRKRGFDPAAMPQEPALDEFPKAEVQLPDLKSEAATLEFNVSLHARNKAITRLEVRADGALIPQAWDKDLLLPAGRSKTLSATIPLADGQNWIEVTPVDSMGIAGDTERFRVIHNSKFESELYVVTLGVSDYTDDSLDLQYAAKDAKDIAESFQKNGNGRVRTLTLTNEEVSDGGALEKVKAFLAAATVHDRVVLYIAGHGMLDDNLEYQYAPAGFDTERMSETGISLEALTNCIQSSAARKYLMLLDTCHSGSLGEADMEKLAASGMQLPQGVRAIQNRGMKIKATSASLSNAVQKKRYIEDLFTTQEGTRGINIIAGTAGSEFALESDEWQNGVFAAAIIETLNNSRSADANGNGFLSVDEFQTQVTKRVSELTGGVQVPTNVSAEDNVMNLAIGRVEESTPSEQPVIATPQQETFTPQVPVTTTEDRSSLDPLIARMAALRCKHADSALYQKRLLTLLPMIRNGADVDITLPETKGNTPLHYSCAIGSLSITKWLLEHGANPNAVTDKGTSPLQCVGSDNRKAITKALRAYGAQ